MHSILYSNFDSSNLPIAPLIMTNSLMISMLKQATNGNDLLAILDTLTEDVSVESDTQPTLETIDFWLDCATS